MVNIKWESVDNMIASVYHWRKFRKGFLNINTRIIVDSTADLLPKLGGTGTLPTTSQATPAALAQEYEI